MKCADVINTVLICCCCYNLFNELKKSSDSIDGQDLFLSTCYVFNSVTEVKLVYLFPQVICKGLGAAE